MLTLLLVVLAAALLAAVATWVLRRRAIERERQRVAALRAIAERLDAVASTLREPATPPEPPARGPAPLSAAGSRGRAAFLDAVVDGVAGVRADGSRLAVALVESDSASAVALAEDVHGVTGGETYEVGACTVAFLVRGVGRAEALGVLARIEAACGATGRAVELEPGEDAVALLARLLARPEGDAGMQRRG